MKKLRQNERGIAHVGLIVLGALIIGAIGFTAFRVMNKDKKAASEATVDSALQEVAKAECEKLNDKDLCKFYSNWKISEKYQMTTTASDGSKASITIDGDNTHSSMSGPLTYEIITIGKTTYTKAGSVWYKQTATAPEQQDAPDEDFKVELDEPADEGEASPDKTVYKSLGKEACGNLQCFKYEVVDPDNEGNKQYIWFDDKDYLLRRTLFETPEGNSDTVFAYENVAVTEPSPVQELGPNQFIVPGQTEPMTLP